MEQIPSVEKQYARFGGRLRNLTASSTRLYSGYNIDADLIAQRRALEYHTSEILAAPPGRSTEYRRAQTARTVMSWLNNRYEALAIPSTSPHSFSPPYNKNISWKKKWLSIQSVWREYYLMPRVEEATENQYLEWAEGWCERGAPVDMTPALEGRCLAEREKPLYIATNHITLPPLAGDFGETIIAHNKWHVSRVDTRDDNEVYSYAHQALPHSKYPVIEIYKDMAERLLENVVAPPTASEVA